MSIYDDVNAGLKSAMRERAPARLRALRSIRAAFLNEMKRDNSERVEDAVCIGLLRKLEKQRQESIEAFAAADRTEQADAERAELAVIREHLPALADEAQTRAWVRDAIESSGASEPGHAGKVMGALMKAHRGDVDGTLAKRIAEELLRS